MGRSLCFRGSQAPKKEGQPIIIPYVRTEPWYSMLIDNGKLPDEPFNVRLGFWLPPQTPYGNFQLKFMKITERVDEANRQIANSHRFWQEMQSSPGGFLPPHAHARHQLANEQAVYLMRRAADKIVSMIWCLSEYEKTRRIPKKIEQDSLAGVLRALNHGYALVDYAPHQWLMQSLNEISNAYKHSFINSDITVVGAKEPAVYALALEHNRVAAGARLYGIGLDELTRRYTAFYRMAVEWLRLYSERCRTISVPACVGSSDPPGEG